MGKVEESCHLPSGIPTHSTSQGQWGPENWLRCDLLLQAWSDISVRHPSECVNGVFAPPRPPFLCAWRAELLTLFVTVIGFIIIISTGVFCLMVARYV